MWDSSIFWGGLCYRWISKQNKIASQFKQWTILMVWSVCVCVSGSYETVNLNELTVNIFELDISVNIYIGRNEILGTSTTLQQIHHILRFRIYIQIGPSVCFGLVHHYI